jgi:hypothetical protein
MILPAEPDARRAEAGLMVHTRISVSCARDMSFVAWTVEEVAKGVGRLQRRKERGVSSARCALLGKTVSGGTAEPSCF